MEKSAVILALGVFVLSSSMNALALTVNEKPYFHPVDAETGKAITESTYAGKVIADPKYNCTPQDAYNMAVNEPNTYILDVRTPCEWNWVGHPGKNKAGEGAALETPAKKVFNIPWQIWQFDKTKGAFTNVKNENFENEAKKTFSGIKDLKIITMCRSGHRSVPAAEAIESWGIPVINMLDGFEGGADANGYRTANGWKVLGLPYNFSTAGIYTANEFSK